MKHETSAEAANKFWDLAFQSVPHVIQQRRKKVPKLQQQRKKMFQNLCPEIQMKFAYKNKLTGEIIIHHGTTAPLKIFRDTQKYEKLYEMAYVKVINQFFYLTRPTIYLFNLYLTNCSTYLCIIKDLHIQNYLVYLDRNY